MSKHVNHFLGEHSYPSELEALTGMLAVSTRESVRDEYPDLDCGFRDGFDYELGDDPFDHLDGDDFDFGDDDQELDWMTSKLMRLIIWPIHAATTCSTLVLYHPTTVPATPSNRCL